VFILAIFVLGTNSADPCSWLQQEGFHCADCETLVYCTKRKNEPFKSSYTVTCGKGQICDKVNKYCAPESSTNQCSRGYKFECFRPGLFPDPNSCTHYYNCDENLKESIYTCPPGLEYSASLKECIPGRRCMDFKDKCTSDFQVVQWPFDENLLYVCKQSATGQFNPLFFRCPKGYKFESGSCQKENITEDSQTGGYLLADPDNCKAFFTVHNNKLIHYYCPNGQFFDERGQSCATGKCLNLKFEIKN